MEKALYIGNWVGYSVGPNLLVQKQVLLEVGPAGSRSLLGPNLSLALVPCVFCVYPVIIQQQSC